MVAYMERVLLRIAIHFVLWYEVTNVVLHYASRSSGMELFAGSLFWTRPDAGLVHIVSHFVLGYAAWCFAVIWDAPEEEQV